MSQNEIITKINALQDWEALMEEARAEAEAIRDELKQLLLSRETSELTAGQYIVRFTPVLSQRFDSTAFKRDHSQLYKEYLRQSESRRFSISG